jgi:hypothetical protein
MNQATTVTSIQRSVSLKCSVEHAFAVFTERTAEWWPLRTHSIGEDEALDVRMEPHEGGHVYEVMRDGTEAYWATVRVWDPPSHLVLDWMVNPASPGPTRIDVRFTPEEAGCRVDLEHSGWEIYGERALEMRGSYGDGWAKVMSLFAAVADA